jgi:hypothetical protein
VVAIIIAALQEASGFTISGQALLTIGGIVGTLAGVISLLFKLLLSAKDAQLAAREKENQELRDDNEFLRAELLRALQTGERAANAADQATQIARARSRR